MKKDKLIISVSTMITLISLNCHTWINELKTIVKKQEFENMLIQTLTLKSLNHLNLSQQLIIW
jgi:hypothetical protein